MLRAATIGEWFIEITKKMRPLRPISVSSRRTDTVMLFAVINFCTFPTKWAIENIENTSLLNEFWMFIVQCTQFRNIPNNNRQSIEVGKNEQKKQKRYTPENVQQTFSMNFSTSAGYFALLLKVRSVCWKKNCKFSYKNNGNRWPDSAEWNNATQIMRMI